MTGFAGISSTNLRPKATERLRHFIRRLVLSASFNVKISARIIGVRVGTESVDGIFIMRESQHYE